MLTYTCCSLSHVWLFVKPWTVQQRASLSFTISRVCSNSCPWTQWCHPTISFYIHMYFYINISSEQDIWTDFIQQMWFQQIVTFIGNWPGSSPQIRFAFSEVGPSPGGSSCRLCPLTPRPEMKGMTNKWHLIGAEGPVLKPWTLGHNPSKEQTFPLLQTTSNLFTKRKREGKEFPS